MIQHHFRLTILGLALLCCAMTTPAYAWEPSPIDDLVVFSEGWPEEPARESQAAEAEAVPRLRVKKSARASDGPAVPGRTMSLGLRLFGLAISLVRVSQ